jgi:hypothetical protein
MQPTARKPGTAPIQSPSPDTVVEVPLTVSSVSCRASIRDFHIFSETHLTRSMKTSIFCEIRFAR